MHRWAAAALRHQYQHFHRGLRFFGVAFGLGQLGDVERGVAEREELATARQRDRIIELS